jgi:regulator of sirC expression with transglutaminase-like and TPR domain
MAQLYINSKQPKRAREKLETLLRHYPNDPAATKAKEMLSGISGE